MRTIKKTAIIALVFFNLIFLNSLCKNRDIVILNVYTFNRPPLYIVQKNRFSGILIEKARKIFDQAGINYKFIEIPPARILNHLSKEKNACSIGWFKTPKRQKRFIFSKPIYSENSPFVFVIRKNLKINPEKALNFSSFSIVLVKGFSYGETIDKKLSKSKIKKFYVPKADGRKILLILKNKRADISILTRKEAQFLVKKSEFKDSIKIIPFNEKTAIYRYIIFSKKTDKTIIEKINKAIEELN